MNTAINNKYKLLTALLSIVGGLLMGLGYATQFLGVDLVTHYAHVNWIGYLLMLIGFVFGFSHLFFASSNAKIKLTPIFISKIQALVAIVAIGSFFLFGTIGLSIFDRLALLLVALGLIAEFIQKLISSICSRIDSLHVDKEINNGLPMSVATTCFCRKLHTAIKYYYGIAAGIIIGGFARSILTVMIE